jgi:hypothetical protein
MKTQLSNVQLAAVIIFSSLFGFTILSYIAQGSAVVAKITGYIAYLAAKVAAVFVRKTGELAEKGVDAAGKTAGVSDGVSVGAASSGVSLRDKLLEEKARAERKEREARDRTEELTADLRRSLDRREFNPSTQYSAQTSGDSAQMRHNVKKTGYCYVGVDNGVRGCVKVYKDDTCMSGNVYPTQAICMNPSLRM